MRNVTVGVRIETNYMPVCPGIPVNLTVYSKAWSFRNRGVEAPDLISKIEGEIELPPALTFLDFTPKTPIF